MCIYSRRRFLRYTSCFKSPDGTTAGFVTNSSMTYFFSTPQDQKGVYRTSFFIRRTRSQYLFLTVTIFGASFLIFCRNSNIEITELIRAKTFQDDLASDNNRFAIHTEGCSIPGFQPLNKDVQQYVFYPTVERCNTSMPLLDNNRTHIWINENNRRNYNNTGSENIICCYQSFYRPYSVNDVTSSKVDDRVEYNKCIPFSKAIKVADEFVKVECTSNSTVIYRQFFIFTPKKGFSHKDIKEISRNKAAYNVLVLGIDAVSRLNFHRTMPKTFEFLNSKGAVELLGYNKVGDNTFPNAIPMLLGIKSPELRQYCLPNPWSTFDNCPFIWEWFKQAGYYTAFGEDTSSLGTFNYFRTGFIDTPTDYYLHTFINEAEKNAGKNKDFNSFLCMNDKPFYKVLLNYIENLVSTLKLNKLFGFFWEVTMSHDYLNYPMIMDTDYKRFLNKLETAKYLDESILFLVSDHGLRWGKMRSTRQGGLEERLPFVFILVPESFRSNYKDAFKNLMLNSKRLTTPFDIHATLRDLVNLDNIKNEQIQSRKLRSYWQDRSISLFLPIPSNRTCKTADIDDQWCTCERSHKLSVKSKEALNASSQLLLHLNKLLVDYSQCASLRLVEIIHASELELLRTPDKTKESLREFVVVIRTDPGGAILEATLRYDDGVWSLAGTASRLNLYGDQSRCISDTQLKLYCFCI